MKWILAAVLLFSLNLSAEDNLESILEAGSSSLPKETKSAEPTGLAAIVIKSSKTLSPDQSVFVRYLEASEWTKALLQYPAAFEGKPFAQSATGRALHAYLYFKSGLETVGLEKLFSMVNPTEVAPELAALWKVAAPEGHPAWAVASLQWNKNWEKFWDESIAAASIVASTDGKDIEKLKSLIEKTPESSLARGKLEWKLVLAYSLNDQADKAAKLLAVLMKRTNPPVGVDLMNVTAGRLLFQNGYFDAALRYYEKVPKSSEYWTQAQEEMAWTFLKKGEPQNSLALSNSLARPELSGLAGPEAYFVKSLSQLKICDYPGVLNSLQQFPKAYQQRSVSIDALVQDPNKPESIAVIEKLKKGRLYSQDLKAIGKPMPRALSWDGKLYEFAQNQVQLEKEQAAAESVYAQSLAMTGLQGEFDTLKKASEMKVQKAKAAALSRIKELAQDELEETKVTLQKLHIVEAEVIQQVSVAERVAKNLTGSEDVKLGTTGSKAKDVLSFPAENEVWFDEIGNYKADVKKGCTVKKKSL